MPCMWCAEINRGAEFLGATCSRASSTVNTKHFDARLISPARSHSSTSLTDCTPLIYMRVTSEPVPTEHPIISRLSSMDAASYLSLGVRLKTLSQ